MEILYLGFIALIVWLVVRGVQWLENFPATIAPNNSTEPPTLLSGGEVYWNGYRYKEMGNGYGESLVWIPGRLDREDIPEIGNILQGAKCCVWGEDPDMRRLRRDIRDIRAETCQVVDKIEKNHILEVELHNVGNRCSCFCEIPSCFTRNPFCYIDEMEASVKMYKNRDK